ncbi:MAG: hypothetical protein A3K09_01090 [Nitrospinae bacterium RIFCSPLOWO2_12_FULL_47_7]|nr:MAG: hypothetical protein A3K09_01090 [Nitrospinae bacterium RIFCSPLOWO2_12_FULL_47_7]
MSLHIQCLPNSPNPSLIAQGCNIVGKFAAFLGFLYLLHTPAFAIEYQYQLFKNQEDFGILVFPKENMFEKLNQYIQSINFIEVASGNAVMRFGSANRDNQTYMMPESVQKQHNIEKFIILQVLADQGILVGIYDPTWGLTLPFATYSLDDVKENIQKSLDVFRNKKSIDASEDRGKTILWQLN